MHTCHKLWTKICEIRQNFKGDLTKFCEIFLNITSTPPPHPLSWEFGSGVPWEDLYANDLVIIAESLEECVRRLLTWKEAMEKKGLRVNAGKTKIMICGTGLDLLQSTGVGSNSIFCNGCKHWVHKKCSGLKHLTEDPDYRCTQCQGMPLGWQTTEGSPGETWQGLKLEMVASFCYLGDMLFSSKWLWTCNHNPPTPPHPLSWEFGSGVPWEDLYANDLVIIAESLEECVRRLLTWKEAMEKKGLRVNAGKTKIMICGTGLDLLQSTGVGSNSIFCNGCKHWVHKKCSGLKHLTEDPDYRCTQCQGMPLGWQTTEGSPGETWQGLKLEMVASFCYLGDMLFSSKWLWTCNHNMCENCLEEVQGCATSSLFKPPLFRNMWPCVQLLCEEHNAPCQWDLAIDKAKPPASAAKWQGNEETDLQCQTLSLPGPISYLCGCGSGPHPEGEKTAMVWTCGTLQWCSQDSLWHTGWWKAWTWEAQDDMEAADREGLQRVEALGYQPSWQTYLEIWCEICHVCSKPAIWKRAHWCGFCPCTCMLINNLIMMIWWWYDEQ